MTLLQPRLYAFSKKYGNIWLFFVISSILIDLAVIFIAVVMISVFNGTARNIIFNFLYLNGYFGLITLGDWVPKSYCCLDLLDTGISSVINYGLNGRDSEITFEPVYWNQDYTFLVNNGISTVVNYYTSDATSHNPSSWASDASNLVDSGITTVITYDLSNWTNDTSKLIDNGISKLVIYDI